MNKLMKRMLSLLAVIMMILAGVPVFTSADDIPSIGIGGGMNGSLSPDRNVEILVSADKGGQVQFMLTLSDGEAAPRVGGVSLNAPDGNGTYTFDRHFDAGESLILSLSADRETGYSLATKMTREDVVLEEEPAEEPAQTEAAEEPAEEPAQAEDAEEPAEEPAQEEAAEEPAAEPAQAEAIEEQPETTEAGATADPEPEEEEIPEFEINGDVLKKYNGDGETVTVPDGIRVIGTKAFAGNKTITKVILPDTVEVIKNYAFDDCSNLETIVKGPESSLRTIGIGAFQNAIRLDASFADDVTNVVSNAFELTETAEEIGQAAEEAAETVSPEDCSVQISISWDTDDPQVGDVAHFDSVLTGYENLPYTLQWQTSRDNETWTDYPGATGPQLDVILTEDMDGILFRLSVNVESKQEE